MYNPLKPGSAVPDDDDEDDDSVEIDSDVQRKFWYLVVVFNLAVLAASLGLLFLYFRGQLLLGGGLAAVGFAGLAYGFYTYWRVQREFAEEDARADAEANDESDE
ncbi:DUF7322 domain-containing protein [Halarchaeum sp. P4]|uniref:DUF7322 domain-containing protein n=1 Tax=Halarchaeum sp. P4 TaxID=3421639 RepID=UPI003EB717FC